jgi:hypothetical protein
MKKIVTVGVCLITLSACSLTVPVNGTVGKKEFLGRTTAVMFGDTTFDVTTEDGMKCYGITVEGVGEPSGWGTFNCDDGAKGKFYFTAITKVSGKGFGKTNDGRKLSFTYGNPTVMVETK